MINVYVKSGEAINLGREGTKGVRRVIFDFTRWAREYGEGSVQLIVMRHGDTSPYPVALIIDGEEAVWEVGAADTAIPGEGECEWQYFVGEALEKSETFKTFVENAMGDAADEAPEAAQGWVEQVLEAAAKAETAIKKAPIIFADTWWIWDAEAEEYVDTGVAARGPAGPKGDKGDTGATGLQGPVGPAGATGQRGEKGDAGERGPTGPTGPAGPRGYKGDKGDKGDPFTYSDFTSAQLAALKGPQGDPGPAGANGAPGANGVTPEFSIGTVETLAPGTPASASVTGTAEKPVLNLGIPRGADGASGEGGGSGLVITNTAAVGQTVKITAIDADGKPTEWEAVDFPEGGGLPASGVAHQQLITDENGKVVWADRAYGYVSRLVRSVDETIYTQLDANLGIYVGYAYYDPVSEIDSVTVVYDNTTRYNNLEIQDTPVGRAAGNLSMLNSALGTNYEDTGEPFVFADITATAMAITTNLFAPEAHRFVVFFDGNYEQERVIIDHKELPYGGEGLYAEAFNENNTATGKSAHAEGDGTSADAAYSHTEGYKTNVTSKAEAGHAEGSGTTVHSQCGHAEGSGTVVSTSAEAGHAEGSGTTVHDDAGHAEGTGTASVGRSQHVQGEWNIIDDVDSPTDEGKERAKYAHIVGNGTSDTSRSNAHTLDWSGVGWYAGGLKVGGTGQDDANAKSVLLEGDVYSKPEIDAIMGSYINDIAAIVGGDA